MSDKKWVVLDFGTHVDVVADYGDFAWGSTLYRVVGYYDTRLEATKVASEIRKESRT